MNKVSSVLLALVLITSLVFAGCAQQTFKPYPEERNKFWLEDIDYIQKSLPQRHANLFAHISEKDFVSKMEKLKEDIPNISDEEIPVRLMEIFAPVQDAHLFIVNFHSDMQKLFSVKTFLNVSLDSRLSTILPLKTGWFGESLYVTEIDSEYSKALGTKLVKINGLPINEVMGRINGLIPHNNEQRLRFLGPMHLVNPQVLRHFDLLKKDTAACVFQKENGETFNLNIKVKNKDDVKFAALLDNVRQKPLAMKSDALYWYEYLPDKNSLYFRLATYSDIPLPKQRSYDEPKGSGLNLNYENFSKYKSFMNEMLKTLEDKKVDKLIIDLRGNNGGDPGCTSELRKYISSNAELNQKGKLFILVDKGSFSAPILDCQYFREKTNALIVGEPTGERPFKASGAGANILPLPNSKLTILYSQGEFVPVDEKVDSLVPDILVEPSINDYKNGVDTILEAVFSYQDSPK